MNQACLQHRSVGKRSSHRIRQARPIHVTGHVLEIILKIVDHDGDHLYPVPCKVFKDELHHVKSVDVDVGIPLVVFDTTIIQLLRSSTKLGVGTAAKAANEDRTHNIRVRPISRAGARHQTIQTSRLH